MVDDIISKSEGFEWDDRNFEKNWLKHKISMKEAEEVFFNIPLFILDDKGHSDKEARFLAFGNSDEKKLIIIAFTLRKRKLRVIMARSMSKKERSWYNAQEKNA